MRTIVFDITDNFALAIRLNHIHESIPGKGSICVYSAPAGFVARATQLGSDGETKEELTVETEREVWLAFPALVPWVLDELATSPNVYYRGLARRAELMRTHSDAEFETLLSNFERAPRLMWTALLTAFGGMHLSKSTLTVRSKALKRGIGLWELRARVGLSHYNEPVSMAVQCFPSPVENDAWMMRVQLPAISTEVILRNQVAIRLAVSNLAREGVRIEDVTQGTNLVLSL